MPGGRLTRAGYNPQRTLGTLLAPPLAGHGSDPGIEKPPPPALTQVWHNCHMEVTKWQASGHGHLQQGRGLRHKQRREEEVRRITKLAFQAYERSLVVVSEFKYLGRALTALYDNWTEVVGSLRKAWKRWARMLRILGQEGADPRTSGKTYNMLVRATLLFGAELWVMSPRIGRTLGGFQHRVTCRLANMQLNRTGAGRRIYPYMDEFMNAVGLEKVEM